MLNQTFIQILLGYFILKLMLSVGKPMLLVVQLMLSIEQLIFVDCSFYVAGCAAHVCQCENKANSVQLSWSWD